MSKLEENKSISDEDEHVGEKELRKGPWTIEEDTLLSNYIKFHGEGRWNLLAKSSGLKRTGKSCRLRWLNYLKPDIKRGNLSSREQIMILELHSKWGNRWSKIAQHLPGRTDNEIKNYWRTRVQKQARQLKVDSTSKNFLDALRQFWVPRLREKMARNSPSSSSSISSTSTQKLNSSKLGNNLERPIENQSTSICSSDSVNMPKLIDNSVQTSSTTSTTTSYYNTSLPNECYHVDISTFDMAAFSQADITDMSVVPSDDVFFSDCQLSEIDWATGANIWDLDDLCFE